MHALRARLVVAMAALAVASLGCTPSGPRPHAAHGVVRDVMPDAKQVVIEHDDIPGLMPAMTMSFDVPEARLLAGLSAGDEVDFDVQFDGRHYRVTRLERRARGEAGESGGGDAGETGASGRPGASAASGASRPGVAREADVAPAFELVDQDGRPRSLASLRGKTVLLDFVYTSCRGPCPILTGLHVDVQKALSSEARAGSWIVSISLDPEVDTPAKLREYATARGADLSNWSFLTGPRDVVSDVVLEYGVGTIRRVDGQIDHVVATFLIDGEGRIAKRWLGLEHEAADVAREIAAHVRPAS